MILSRVVKSSRLPGKIAAYLVSIGRLLCLAFLYGWCFLNKNILGLVKKHLLKTIASVYVPLTVSLMPIHLIIFGNFGEKIAWRVQKTAFQSV